MTVPASQSVVQIVENKVNEVKDPESGSILQWFYASWTAVLAEVISTCLLILLGCASTIPIDNLPYQPPTYAPFAFGFMVMLNIQIFGHLSGAHMNPAVTVATVLWGILSIPMAIAYFVAQLAGAALGYGILTLLYPVNLVPGGVCVTRPHPQINEWQALGVEIALTTGLIFLCCGFWDPNNKDKQDSAPVKFGLAIAGLSLVGGPLTGASMNPARSLAPALFTGSWQAHWVYWVGPLIAGVLPTLFYKMVWLKEDEDSAKKTDANSQDNTNK